MEFLSVLWKHSNRPSWVDACHWSLWNLLGSLFPLWGGLICAKVFGEQTSLADFTAHGEFVLYAASFCGATLYLTLRPKKRVPSRSLIAFVFVCLLTISAIVYAAVVVSSIVASGGSGTKIHLDQPFIYTTGLIVFAISCALSFLMVVVDNVLASLDLKGISDDKFADLSKEFDELGDKK